MKPYHTGKTTGHVYLLSREREREDVGFWGLGVGFTTTEVHNSNLPFC